MSARGESGLGEPRGGGFVSVDDLAYAGPGSAYEQKRRQAESGVVTRAGLLRAVMSALPEAAQWWREVEARGGSAEERRATMMAAVEARATQCAGAVNASTRDLLCSLVAEVAVLIAELEDGSW